MTIVNEFLSFSLKSGQSHCFFLYRQHGSFGFCCPVKESASVKGGLFWRSVVSTSLKTVSDYQFDCCETTLASGEVFWGRTRAQRKVAWKRVERTAEGGQVLVEPTSFHQDAGAMDKKEVSVSTSRNYQQTPTAGPSFCLPSVHPHSTNVPVQSTPVGNVITNQTRRQSQKPDQAPRPRPRRHQAP